MKSLITRRKFYGKWLYRVGLKIPGISILRNHSLDETIDILSSEEVSETRPRNSFILPRTRANSKDIIKICHFLSSLDLQKWSKRIETTHIDIYTNDPDIYDQCQQALKFAVVSISAPDADSLDIIENSNHVVVKKYPHDKYQFKVYLQPHKLKGNKESKIKFLQWLDTQDRILISAAVKNWFLATDWNWDRRYLLVEDSNTLLMLKMRGSDVCGKVHEYVIVDK